MTTDDMVRDALAKRIGQERAAALLGRIDSFSNYPNTIKGVAKMPGDPEMEAAALALIQDPDMRVELDLASGDGGPSLFGVSQRAWGLLTLAARVDPAVLEHVPDPDSENVTSKLASIRRAAKKHAASAIAPAEASPARTAPAETPGLAAPARVSDVKGWLAAHPDADVAVLAPYEGQRADARRAAIRALGALGTPDALRVLGDYAQDSYPDAEMGELHRAWGRFDRREFARAMFGRSGSADLGMCKTVEGIGAVPGLTSLTVIFDGKADLAPIAECTALRTLAVGAEGLPGVIDVTPLLSLPELAELQLTRTTRNADLAPLSALPVKRLRISLDGADGSFLLEMPALERVLISGEGYDDEDAAAAHPDLVRVAVELARADVQVVAWTHEKSWVPSLRDAAEKESGVFVVERAGYLGLTSDQAGRDALASRLFSNIVL